MDPKQRAPKNRTLTLTEAERNTFRKQLVEFKSNSQDQSFQFEKIENKTIHGDLFELLDKLPSACCDLLFADPPYNLTKQFGEKTFKKRSNEGYVDWLRTWLPGMRRLLGPTGTIYVCGDWRSSGAIQTVLEESKFIVRNRISWEREKGRGAKTNWKNASEDIWFATVGEDYVFHVDRIKLKRRVIAPYRDETGQPKDWSEAKTETATKPGGQEKFRLTCPSNLWTDISVPFWSMPENTDHPTQKPEKLLAKIILASSEPDDVVLDPFLGSGTTSVVAKKLGRRYIGIEAEEEYCLLAEKRLELAEKNRTIQGYADGVFWERNSKAPV